jgi:DNA mismatch repair protein MutS2
MRVTLDDLRVVNGGVQKNKKPVKSARRIITPKNELCDAIKTSDNTLDLIGTRVDRAIDLSDKFLDDSLQSGTDIVYILTGYGTGALVKAVRNYLKESPYVEKFRPGDEDEGGDAVTCVYLR